ncbi:MAG: lipopolysaccharide assembly outer membrane protein LptD (OstA), partial [Candidatus Endobugula sp.]
MSKYIFFFSSFLFVASLHAQTKVLLKDADLLYSSTVNGVKVDKIIGDVWLIQGNTNIYCDSAYLYKNTNSATAFGHVKIIDTVDSLDLRGD